MHWQEILAKFPSEKFYKNSKLQVLLEFEDPISLSSSKWAWYPWVGLVAGIGVLGQLYLQASQMQVTFLFERFWLGMFLFYIPVFWRLLSSDSSRSERLALLIGTALFSYVPKLFRCPYYFCYSDELTWWRGVQNLLGGNPVLSDNPLGLIQGMFPGLPLLTIVLQKAGGLSTFQAGLLLMGMMRLLSMVSIFLLGEHIFHSSKVGAAAALVYMMNANYLFFSSQFSYESLAVPLLLVILLFLQYFLKGYQDRTGTAWGIVVLVAISALVITHHLATYMMIAISILMIVFTLLLPRFAQLLSSRKLMGVTLYSILAGVGWLYFTHTNVVDYLGDPISRGIEQLAYGTIRKLFLGISLPWYEIVSGYASAILIALLALFGALLILRKREALSSEQIGLLAFGTLYVVTIPLVLTPWGAESGRRSWVYSFISLALLSGVTLAWLVGSNLLSNRRFGKPLGQIIAALALSILLMGGVAASTSISYRFPGEYLQNSDARSYTPEIIDAAQWLFNQAGPHNRVLGDRTTERIFGSYGLQEPAMYGGPKPWEVYLPTSWTSSALNWLERANAPFVVVDKRMAELPPQMDFRFQRGEPLNTYSDRPLPLDSVEKFDGLSQLDRIYDSGNIRIYYLNNTDHSLFKLGNASEIPPVQNPAEINYDSIGLSNEALNLLFIFFRCMFLVTFFVVVPGYVMGSTLFPHWTDIETVTRITLAVTISLSMIILSSFILALLLPHVERAAIIVSLLWGLLLVVGFVRFLLHIFRNQAGRDDFLSKMRLFSDRVRQQDLIWAFALGLVSILLIGFIMGEIKPRNEPHTDIALGLSTITPSVQIINHEKEDKTYQLRIYSGTTNDWVFHPIHLQDNQMFEVNLQTLFLSLPPHGRLYVDLYLDGQEKPYRSLHFSREELTTNSQSLPKKLSGVTQ